jgi:hypothetical protein
MNIIITIEINTEYSISYPFIINLSTKIYTIYKLNR